MFQEGNLWGMAMEYIDGGDLADRLINYGVLNEDEALLYIQQIGEALIVVHQQKLLHRDIKPQNIMLRSGKKEAVLIDFGIAREFTPNLTQTHTQFLTEGFAPLEQYYKRAERGVYTDIYALAATLYNLLTGKVPTSALDRDKGSPLELPQSINPQISDTTNKAILKGMELKAHKRPQSMQGWLQMLGVAKTIAFTPSAKTSRVISSRLSRIFLVLVPICLIIGIIFLSRLFNPNNLVDTSLLTQSELNEFMQKLSNGGDQGNFPIPRLIDENGKRIDDYNGVVRMGEKNLEVVIKNGHYYSANGITNLTKQELTIFLRYLSNHEYIDNGLPYPRLMSNDKLIKNHEGFITIGKKKVRVSIKNGQYYSVENIDLVK